MKKIFFLLIIAISIYPVFSVSTTDNSTYTDIQISNETHTFITKTLAPISNNVSIINVAPIVDGSQIINATINMTINGDSHKSCILRLKDAVLNEVTISDKFQCSGTKKIPLNDVGKDALENNLGKNTLGLTVKDTSLDNIPFSSVTLDSNYTLPQYFAKIENGIVTNVIVADKSFIDTQPGIWLETKYDGSIRANFAGVGYSYDSNTDRFIPIQPYPSWSLDSKGHWQAPFPYPTDGKRYNWNETNYSWTLAN